MLSGTDKPGKTTSGRFVQPNVRHRRFIDALFAMGDKSEAREATGDFIDIRDQAHLDDEMQQMLDDAVKRGRALQRR